MMNGIFCVDAFSTSPFQGNPAAVCLLKEPAGEQWMQSLASEMNLSETAFVYPLDLEKRTFHLRWFTPVTEVDLCGHATLASAHILESIEGIQGEMAFSTRSGWLKTAKLGDVIQMTLPRWELDATVKPPDGLAEALGVAHGAFVQTGPHWLVDIESAQQVRRIKPDFAFLKSLNVNGVMVTAASDNHHADFISRFFAPSMGVDEDPVTGSAHCALGPYWAAKLGKDSLVALQASQRSGTLYLEIFQDSVKVGGHCRTVYEGRLCI